MGVFSGSEGKEVEQQGESDWMAKYFGEELGSESNGGDNGGHEFLRGEVRKFSEVRASGKNTASQAVPVAMEINRKVAIASGTRVLVQPVGSPPWSRWDWHTMTGDREGILVEDDGLGTQVVQVGEFLVQVRSDRPDQHRWTDHRPVITSEIVPTTTRVVSAISATCGHPATWQDPQGVWRCHLCQPAPHPSMIRDWRGDVSEDPRVVSRATGCWPVEAPDSLPWAWGGESVPGGCARPGETFDEWWARTSGVDELIADVQAGRLLWAAGETPDRSRFRPPDGAKVWALVWKGKDDARLSVVECKGGALPDRAVSATWEGCHCWHRVG
jgi:hypothetical protein